MAAVEIPLAQLLPADWNPNRASDDVVAKIKRSITKYGFVENLVARPHPTQEGMFELLSGNHRLKILADLKVKAVPVEVVELSDVNARLLAQTLNRTRGRDDPVAYRRMINDLLSVLPVEEVTALLPEDTHSLAYMLANHNEPAIDVQPVWGAIIDCADETDQEELLERFREEGRECRPLT